MYDVLVNHCSINLPSTDALECLFRCLSCGSKTHTSCLFSRILLVHFPNHQAQHSSDLDILYQEHPEWAGCKMFLPSQQSSVSASPSCEPSPALQTLPSLVCMFTSIFFPLPCWSGLVEKVYGVCERPQGNRACVERGTRNPSKQSASSLHSGERSGRADKTVSDRRLRGTGAHTIDRVWFSTHMRACEPVFVCEILWFSALIFSLKRDRTARAVFWVRFDTGKR